MINQVFECEEPCIWQGQNKVFFKRRLATPERPYLFLVTVRPLHVLTWPLEFRLFWGSLSVRLSFCDSAVALLTHLAWHGLQNPACLLTAASWLHIIYMIREATARGAMRAKPVAGDRHRRSALRSSRIQVGQHHLWPISVVGSIALAFGSRKRRQDKLWRSFVLMLG